MRINLSLCRGFSLTEIAIVLGVVGLILGAVWTAAAHVYSQKRINDFERELSVTLENIRLFYHNQTFVVTGDSTNNFLTEYQAGMYPANFLAPQSAWPTSAGFTPITTDGYYIMSQTDALLDDYGCGGGGVYTLNIMGSPVSNHPLTEDMCIRILTDISRQGDSILQVRADNGGWINPSACFSDGSGTAGGISVSDARQACDLQGCSGAFCGQVTIDVAIGH